MLKRIRPSGLVFWVLVVAWVIGFGLILSSLPRPNNQPSQNIKCGKAGDGYPQGHYWECSWERTMDDPVAFFTLALVFLGTGQAALFLWQLRLIREGLADTKNAADAAKESAETAAKSFSSLERPYLYIFDVADQFLFDRSTPMINNEVYITFTVANYGKIPEIIIDGAAILKSFRHTGDENFLDEVPRQFTAGHTLIKSPILPPGKMRNICQYAVFNSIKGTVVGPADKYWFAPQPDPDEDVFLWIVLTYRGPFTEGHETSGANLT
jgi:hypothetical protein